jgi:hypothetical protein
MGFIFLQKVAEEMEVEQGTHYLIRFKCQIYKMLQAAALRGDLAVYDPTTKLKYIPAYPERTIFTTKADVNLWLASIEAPYRYDLPDYQVAAGDVKKEPGPIKSTHNNGGDIGLSGLLNNPQRIDDWFSAIDDMTRAFYAHAEKMPTRPQAWAQLWTNPPPGYEITTSEDRGEECLEMPGKKPLGKRAFYERWKKYTEQGQNKTL